MLQLPHSKRKPLALDQVKVKVAKAERANALHHQRMVLILPNSANKTKKLLPALVKEKEERVNAHHLQRTELILPLSANKMKNLLLDPAKVAKEEKANAHHHQRTVLILLLSANKTK